MSRPPNFRFCMLAPALICALFAATSATAEGTAAYWASFRADEVNMRVGPGEDYRINWVYHRKYLPVKVLREMEGWRLIQDQQGARGWVVVRLLSKQRTAMVVGVQPANMRLAADDNAKLAWRLTPGVVGFLGDCAQGWCKLNVERRAGYVHQAALWGTGNP